MTTTKSYSSKSRFFSMYKASLKSQLPFAVVTTILVFLLVPVFYFAFLSVDNMAANAMASANPTLYYLKIFQQGVYVETFQSAMIAVILGIMAIVCALSANAYMQSKKMTDLYHALPVSRPQLLCANFLSAMTVILAPFAVITLLTMAAQLIGFGRYNCFGVNYFGYIAADFIGVVVYVAVVYLFTTFVAVNVGTVFDAFAITGVLGITPLSVYLISGAVWAALTYGADFSPGTGVMLLSPFSFLFHRYSYVNQAGALPAYNYAGILLFLAVWAVIGVVLFLAAIQCYKHRKSEIAEQTQSTGVFQTIVKCFATLCGAAMFLAVFFSASLPLRLVAMLFGAVIVGVIAELILSRGVKSLLKNLKLLACFGAVWCVLAVCVSLDVTGYVKRLPDASQITSVAISYRGRFDAQSEVRYAYDNPFQRGSSSVALTQPESIDAVLQMHSKAIADQPPINSDDKQYPYQNIRLEYTLKNGKTLSRYYHNMNIPALLELVNLEDKDDFITANHSVFFYDYMDTPQVQLIRTITLSNARGAGGDKLFRPSDAELSKLLEAIRYDLLAEAFGEITAPTSPALGYIQIQYKDMREVFGEAAYTFDSVYQNYEATVSTVLVTPGYTRTIAALQELGLYDSMVNQAQTVDKIILTPTYNSVQQVVTFIPSGSYAIDRYAKMGGQSDVLEVTDQAAIAAIQQAARNQKLIAGETEMHAVLNVTYMSGDMQYSAQIISVNDLPPDLRNKAQAMLDQAYEDYNNGLVYPQATPYYR